MHHSRIAIIVATVGCALSLIACDDDETSGSGDATSTMVDATTTTGDVATSGDATTTADATTTTTTADAAVDGTSDASDGRVEATDFDQTCSFDEMCVAVFDGDVCNCGICPTAAIAEDAVPAFEASVTAQMCPPIACPDVECAEDKVPSCQSSKCTLRDAIRISADDYDRSCTVDEDCIAISEGEVCGGCFGCPTAAISATEQAQYQMDTDHDFDCNPGAVCDCAAGTPVCNAGTCELEDPCFDDVACPRGTVCQQLQCVEVACQTREDCGTDRTCLDGFCTGVECTTDPECASGETCVDLVCADI